jgi:hypothetical protein
MASLAGYIFGLFRTRTTSVLDQYIKIVYGDNPLRTPPDVVKAVQLAGDTLLRGTTDSERLMALAKELAAGPMPYSTHSLAVSVALNIFKVTPVSARKDLFLAQLSARMTVLDWANEGKVPTMLLATFEHTLYKLYKPGIIDLDP